jgi:hypothetical protein
VPRGVLEPGSCPRCRHPLGYQLLWTCASCGLEHHRDCLFEAGTCSGCAEPVFRRDHAYLDRVAEVAREEMAARERSFAIWSALGLVIFVAIFLAICQLVPPGAHPENAWDWVF